MPGLLQQKKALFDRDVKVNWSPRDPHPITEWFTRNLGRFHNRDLRDLFQGMKQARPDNLDYTQVHIGDLIFSKLKDRAANNARNEDWLKYLYGKTDEEIKKTLATVKASMPNSDLYELASDTVSLPSKNPGILIHELGHAIDFNDKKPGAVNNFLRSLYIKYAPTLLKEHRGWSKGISAMQDSVPFTKLDENEYAEAMLDAAQARYAGMGSYIGADAGGLGGAAAGIEAVRRVPGLRPVASSSPIATAFNYGLAGLLGATLGRPFGATGGLETGKYLSNFSDEKKQRLLEQFKQEFLDKRSSTQLLKTAGRALANRIAKGMLSQKDISRAAKQLPDGAVRQIKPVPGFIGPYPKYVIDGARGQFNLADSVITNQGGDNFAGLAVRKIPFRHNERGMEDYYRGMKPLAASLNRKFHSLGGERHTIAPFLSSTKKGLLQRFADGQGNLDADPLIQRILGDLHDGNVGPKNQVLDMSVKRNWDADGKIPKATKIEFGRPTIIDGSAGYYDFKLDKYDKDTIRKYWLSRTPEPPRPQRPVRSAQQRMPNNRDSENFDEFDAWLQRNNSSPANSSPARIPWMNSSGGIPVRPAQQNMPNISSSQQFNDLMKWFRRDNSSKSVEVLSNEDDSFARFFRERLDKLLNKSPNVSAVSNQSQIS
jgi:hypothetical protein